MQNDVDAKQVIDKLLIKIANLEYENAILKVQAGEKQEMKEDSAE